MPQKALIAIGIGLRTGVLRICPEHCRIYCDDDADPGLAYGLAAGLVHGRNDYVAPFADSRELADILQETLGGAPKQCPVCAGAPAPPATATPRHPPPVGRPL